MARLARVTPMVPVADMDAAVAFYTDVLGFDCPMRTAQHCYVQRDDIALRLIAPGPDKDLDHPNAQMHCYVDVTDIDTLFAEWEPRLRAHPTARFTHPQDKPWGMRQFDLLPGGCLQLSFGQPV